MALRKSRTDPRKTMLKIAKLWQKKKGCSEYDAITIKPVQAKRCLLLPPINKENQLILIETKCNDCELFATLSGSIEASLFASEQRRKSLRS